SWNRKYHCDDGTVRTANYILLLDALNFSFWGKPRWTIEVGGERLGGYWALAAALKRAIEEGFDLTDAAALAHLEEPQLAHILRGEHTIPLLNERARHAREVGQVLARKYDGQCANLIEAAGYDAIGVIQGV